jgi:hypothetical protein
MNELFEAAKAEILAIPAATLERPRVARDRVMQLTAALRQEIQPLVATLAGVLAPAQVAARIADFEAIEPRALVYYAADLGVETPWTSYQQARRAELVRKVHEHDETLSQWAVPVFRKNEEAGAVLAEILRGKGIRDDADDAVRLVALFRRFWSSVEGQTPITEATLAEAEAEATELIALLDLAEGDALGSPRDLRRRAFTWWLRPYQELFHLGRYLLRADPEAADRLPAVAAERSAPAKASAPAPAPPPPAPPAAEAPPT